MIIPQLSTYHTRQAENISSNIRNKTTLTIPITPTNEVLEALATAVKQKKFEKIKIGFKFSFQRNVLSLEGLLKTWHLLSQKILSCGIILTIRNKQRKENLYFFTFIRSKYLIHIRSFATCRPGTNTVTSVPGIPRGRITGIENYRRDSLLRLPATKVTTIW